MKKYQFQVYLGHSKQARLITYLIGPLLRVNSLLIYFCKMEWNNIPAIIPRAISKIKKKIGTI